MKKERKAKNLKEVSSELNLVSTIAGTASLAKKVLDFSTLKNKSLLKNGEKILFNNNSK